MARELAAAPRAPPSTPGSAPRTQEFGTLASWLVDVLNAITGNLDREGGAMFPLAAAGQTNANGEAGRGRGVKLGRWTSRVRGLPESFGELPVAALAEEIETDGRGPRPRAVHGRRQPAALDARTPAGSRGARVAGADGLASTPT